ncbi:immunoglobulin-like domain-containing protein, partial [Klebsiella oxytoca]|uniref:immunoglobulin-like domain-containing protein n=1 Tax=Klebsiella oxytoca TaxID=571 RepID=UPI001C8F90C9
VHKVTLSNASAEPETYSFIIQAGTATEDSDYTNTPTFSNGVTYDPATGLITVPAGVTEFTVSYPTLDDVYADDGETTKLIIGGATGIGTINDESKAFDPANPTDPAAQDAAVISLTGDKTVNEGGKAAYVVSVDQAPSEDMTVDVSYSYVSAETGDIKTNTTQVIIKAGTKSASFTVDAQEDNLSNEGDEIYNV